MTEDSGVRVSLDEPIAVPNIDSSSQTKPRKKRKWDQPAESFLSTGIAVPGVLPSYNMTSLGGVAVASVAALAQVSSVNCATITQSKIQDELIAREISINDAEPSVRYKLTKRQTQEEIQRQTGAVVITRGKYHPPNTPPDGNKPLYLHISAGVHLKDMAERILAVDRAAAMVEEMLRQGQNVVPLSFNSLNNDFKVNQPLTTSVFLGFDIDPSMNIAARIRGPNDQYINHIMAETGVTVSLRGLGSGSTEGACEEPLHLFLSSNNFKSLEDAKNLTENLMDTISKEFGVSRVSSCKVYSAVAPPQQVYGAVPPPPQVYGAIPPLLQVYGAVPPPPKVYNAVPPPLLCSTPQQLYTGVDSLGNEPSTSSASSSISSASPTIVSQVSSVIPGAAPVITQGSILQAGLSQSQSTAISYSKPLISSGTNYNGYSGIYPQATPLQQVALALKQVSSTTMSVAVPNRSAPSMSNVSVSTDAEKEKRPHQRRKFQELPICVQGSPISNQDSKLLKPSNKSAADATVRNVSNMPAPRKLVQPSSNEMPPPRPRSMPPPPTPVKSTSTVKVIVQDKELSLDTIKPDVVSDTLVKLMEYGEEEDDDAEEGVESLNSKNTTGGLASRKPFWAV
ncbi:protein RIK isoform X1 [Cucurbita pepo subsp. pepo]|uniref:protein RIK isoform X1 n=1 Tax=Cucurbita pepo subsp. pepo TaxID=3664 RepID=UPI000C9D40AA|nr:protein RIK isoform X1 [Cucurbita pepo subsp. pepo]